MEQDYINKSREIEALKPKDLTKRSSIGKVDIRKYWDKEYLKGIINSITNPKHRMLIQFLWMSGVRISEAINLRKRDIDFGNYVMTVRWLKSRKYNYRNIPLYPTLKEILQVYCSSKGVDDLIFPISRQRAWQLTRKYLKGHPHQLRHSFAVNWLRSGGDIVMLHKILGHSKINTTMEYLKIVPIDVGKELMKMEF
jgi:integrase/recombinase XerD